MSQHTAVASMRKSVLLLMTLALAGLALAAVVVRMPLAGPAIAGAVILGSLLAALVAAGGRVAMARQVRVESGRRDLYVELNDARSERSVLAGRASATRPFRTALASFAFGHSVVVGDTVRVKSLDAIRSTLDAAGTTGGLPFMAEMERFCGRTARVYRVLDKVYDYGRSRQMRRLDGAVLLVGLRCDGSQHGSCEAECYLIWRREWLDPQPRGDMTPLQAAWPPEGARAGEPAAPAQRWRCQYTELTSASTAQAAITLRGLVAPWAAGNVTTGAWAVAVLTRLFNAFQRLRGGMAYPSMPEPGSDKTIVGEPLNRGDWVRIKTPAEIARTLDRNSKNRGLWFDRDMLKFSGQVYRVRGRVKQIVDVNGGAIIPMKTPCIIMEDVHFTGEFQGFGEQHDYLYFRESWLQRTTAPTAPYHQGQT